MYAIVDIETTGGHADANSITEIAVFIHDGVKVTKRFETLLKPARDIPAYISAYTGITNEMVENAPRFDDIAPQLFEILSGNIFIAHNVNFDYSFIVSHFKSSGFDFKARKLCTVRLSRKIFPGLRSYSLGNICAARGIDIEHRHRAGGDAEATVKLFENILRSDHDGVMEEFLKRGSKEQQLPPNLPRSEFDRLPEKPGVYYFYDQAGKIIYIGKAKNIKRRVASHFGGNSGRKQKQEFFRTIFSIGYEVVGTELMALILESMEIKKHWPEYNRAQKKPDSLYGIYDYQDQNGYIRVCYDRVRKNTKPIELLRTQAEAHSFLTELSENFNLCPKLCMLRLPVANCSEDCMGACQKKESPSSYNCRVEAALLAINKKKSYAIIGNGLQDDEYSCILIEEEKYYGMGYVPKDVHVDQMDTLKSFVKQGKETFFIRELLKGKNVLEKEKIIYLTRAN